MDRIRQVSVTAIVESENAQGQRDGIKPAPALMMTESEFRLTMYEWLMAKGVTPAELGLVAKTPQPSTAGNGQPEPLTSTATVPTEIISATRGTGL